MKKIFVTDVVNLNDKPVINVKVFSRYSEENYDTLDELAKDKGYFPVELTEDTKIETEGAVGMQNTHLHSGWIATVNDGCRLSIDSQVKLLNKKIVQCKAQDEDIIVGFCQTGKFSVGYTIYVKK